LKNHDADLFHLVTDGSHTEPKGISAKRKSRVTTLKKYTVFAEICITRLDAALTCAKLSALSHPVLPRGTSFIRLIPGEQVETHPLNLILHKQAEGRTMKQALLIAAMFVMGACAQTAPAPDAVFLVRHAEKTAEKKNPGLTDAGKARAEALAERLQGEGITHIHSSDYIRTRDTAAPLAARLGLDVEIYDAGDLPGMAAKLKSLPGRHLVVGHSNTTPQLTELLGGDGGTPIVEATEYDRLYVVTMEEGQPVKSYLTRYGQ